MELEYINRMKALSAISDLLRRKHKPVSDGLEILKYIGPGLLVTVGFIDPGNWASNIAAGAEFGYTLLWIVTLSTIMLITIQHNVAHLGIVTGLCLAEAATLHTPRPISRAALGTAVLASISTSLAEILGAAIALNMLFRIPILIGAVLSVVFVLVTLLTNTYSKIERWIIAFVSLIGLSFIYELTLVNIPWKEAVAGWTVPSIPQGSIVVIMSVMGAVVMPHNLFLHSEIIQSRQWNLEDGKVIKRQLDYEMLDTLFSMLVGWAINSAMILLAASAFFSGRIPVTELAQAKNLLTPLLGNNASSVFAIALLCSGIASSITSGMAGGSIFAGLYGEPYNIKDSHSRTGVIVSLSAALFLIILVRDPFRGLIYSQVFLSMQLPITVFLQIYLTSSTKVMGKYANPRLTLFTLLAMAAVITYLNVRLLVGIL